MPRILLRTLVAPSLAAVVLTLALPCPVRCQRPASADREELESRYIYDSWSIREGLPQNSINAIVQTRDGYLWLATFGGLMRFDGVRFTVFEMATADGLVSNRILALFEDRRGRLWIGHEQKGVTVLENGVFSAIDSPALVSSPVWAFAQDRAGHVWVATELGLFRVDPTGAVLRLTARQGLPSNQLTSLLVDRRGVLWVGTVGGLARIDDGQVSAFDTRHGLPSSSVRALYEDGRGTLWIGTARGLTRRRGERFELASPKISVYCFLEDRRGNFWIGADDGVVMLESRSGAPEADRRLAHRPFADHFSGRMRSMARDREGNLWVGTNTTGLSRLKERRLRHYSSRHGLPGTTIAGIAPDGEGGIVAGLTGGPLYQWRNGRFTRSEVTGHDADAIHVHSLLRGRAGALWIGGNGELWRLESGALDHWTTADGLPSAWIRALFEDSSARLWLGTEGGGLVRVDADGLTRYSSRDGLLDDDVAVIAEDRQGSLWIGSRDGLSRWRDGEIRQYTAADGLARGIVRTVHEDADGTLWIGTYGGGLSRFKNGVFTNFTRADGLYDNAVSRILEDDEGHLWMLGNFGISRLDRKLLNDYCCEPRPMAEVRGRPLQGVSFGAAEGMREGSGTSQPAGLRTDDGKMWFPTIEGIAMVDTKTFQPNRLPPPVVIENLIADGVAYDVRGGVVEVPPGNGDLQIDYTGLSFVAPEKVRFRYRLDGSQQAWVDAGARRLALFTNVAPGSYTFRVIASNNDGVWNESGANLTIRLLPFVYETTWFRALVAGLVASAGLAVFHLSTRSIQKRNRRLQSEIAERRRAQEEREALIDELEAKNAELERFSYTVSHDLKSPLVTIKGFLGYLEQDLAEGKTERLADNVSFVAGAADQMSLLLDDLLELSRIGQVVDPSDEVALGEIAREAVALVEGRIRERGADVRIEAGMPTVVGDRQRLREVFQNLVENAVKFIGIQAEPRIRVGARVEEADVICFVRDNGAGIAPQYHDNVFGLFNQLDPGIPGTGIGLALVRRIVESHGGRIWVESDGQGRGSTFYFSLPVASRAGAS